MDEDNKLVAPAVREILHLVSLGDYKGVLNMCASSRLSEKDIKNAVTQYGREPVAPPCDFSKQLDIVLVQNTQFPTWSVFSPFWTREEGRSDLSLELTIVLNNNNVEISVDDIRVL